MSFKKKIIYSIPFFFLFGVSFLSAVLLLLKKYFEMLQSNVFLSICIIFMVCLINFLSLKRYKIIWTPILFYSILMVAFVYYFLYLSSKQVVLSTKTIFIVVVSFLTYILGYFSDIKFKFKFPHFHCSMKKCMNFVFYFGILVFIFECALNRYIPIVATFTVGSKYGDFKMIPFLHYFVMLETLLPIYFINDKTKASVKFLKIIIVTFIIINYESRQLVIFLFLSLFTSLFLGKEKVHEARINVVAIIFIGFLFILFIVIGNLRIGSSDVIDYLKAFSGVDKNKDVTLIDLWFNLYTSMNYATFQNILEAASKNGFYGWGRYTLRPVLSLFLLDRMSIIQYPTEYNSFDLLGTYICDIYLDFGFIGIIVINFLYGIISKGSLERMRQDNSVNNQINYTLVLYVTLMFSFTNFFTTVFVFLCYIFSNCFLYKRKMLSNK